MSEVEYKPNSALLEAIKSHDVASIRRALTQIISADLGFKTGRIYHAIKYAEGQGINVYENTLREDLEIIENRSEWNDDYYDIAMVNLQYNFTRERLKHLEEVGKYLYSKPEKQKPQTDVKEGEPNRPKDQRTTRRQIIIGGLIGLIILVALIIYGVR